MRRVLSALGALAGLVTTVTAEAQGNYRAMPNGGRSALMGNTGVAMARDGAAPFLNPATISDITETRLALSFNFFAVTNTRIDAMHAPRDPAAPLAQSELTDWRASGLPTTFCLFFTLGNDVPEQELADRKLALCIGTTERRDLFATDTKSGAGPSGDVLHIASIERRWGRGHVGPSYSRTFGNRLSIGASLHVVDTTTTAVTTAASSGIGSGQGATASSFQSVASGSSYDGQLLLGARYRLDRHTMLGIAGAPPSVHLTGSMDVSEHSQNLAPGVDDYARTRAGDGSFSAPLPAQLAVGIGHWTPKLRIEADMTYFFAFGAALSSDLRVRTVTQRGNLVDDASSRVESNDRVLGVLDSAVGAEVFLSDNISLLGGFATDFGALPRLEADPPLGSIATTRDQRFITSFGIGSYGGGSELLFGAQLALARGQALVADTFSVPGVLAPVQTHSTTLLFVLAGSTNLSEIRRTLDNLRRTIPPMR